MNYVTGTVFPIARWTPPPPPAASMAPPVLDYPAHVWPRYQLPGGAMAALSAEFLRCLPQRHSVRGTEFRWTVFVWGAISASRREDTEAGWQRLSDVTAAATGLYLLGNYNEIRRLFAAGAAAYPWIYHGASAADRRRINAYLNAFECEWCPPCPGSC